MYVSERVCWGGVYVDTEIRWHSGKVLRRQNICQPSDVETGQDDAQTHTQSAVKQVQRGKHTHAHIYKEAESSLP